MSAVEIDSMLSFCRSPEKYLEEGKNKYYCDYIAYVFWILSNEIYEETLIEIWSNDIVDFCVELGIAQRKSELNRDIIVPKVRIIPFHDMLFITDIYDRTYNDMIYLSYDSLVFSELLIKHRLSGQVICDIFCGSGIIGIVAAHGYGYKMIDNLKSNSSWN